MRRRRLTENDVIEYNEAFLREMSRKHGRRLHADDSYNLALHAMLRAVRSYDRAYHNTDFFTYAETVIRGQLNRERQANDKIYYNELGLMDRLADEEGTETCGALFFRVPDFMNGVMLRDFLGSIEEDFRATAYMLINRYRDDEICRIRRISDLTLQFHKRSIAYYYEIYNAC